MSESDGIDDAVSGGFRQSLMLASQIAERLARARQESMRQRQDQVDRSQIEAQRQIAAERTAMRATVAPTEHDRWWDQANPDQVVEAHQAAEAWKDHDPQALAASEKISEEVGRRYGINTHELNGDSQYIGSAVEAQQAEQARTQAVREHQGSMGLIAAAQAEEIRANAAALRPEVERHQVPEDYLASPELVEALNNSREATGPDATAEADRAVAERMHLIEKDGVNGPSIDQLREEIGQNYSGADDSLFKDPEFVNAAKDWHESKALAEGGFVEKGNTGLEARYGNSEEGLFDRIGVMGRDIESDVLKDNAENLRGQAGDARASSAAAYGSTEHSQEFANSLKGSANEEHIQGRILAATDQGKHPRNAVKNPAKAPKARKTKLGFGMGKDKIVGGPTR